MQNFIAQAIRKAMGVKNPEQHPVTSPADKTQQRGSPLAHMYNNRWNRATLEYPYDIQQRSDLGHYMMFYINVPNETQYSKLTNKSKKAGKDDYQYKTGGWQKHSGRTKESSILRSGQHFSMKKGKRVSSEMVRHLRMSDRGIERDKSKYRFEGREAFQGTAGKQAKNAPRTSRTKDSIVLYMPPNISTTYGAGWKDVEYGMVGGSSAMMGAISSAEQALSGGKSDAIKAKLMDAVKAPSSGPDGIEDGGSASGVFAEFTTRKMGGSLGTMAGAGEAFTALDKMANRALNNYVEAVFTGIGYRKFSYTWKFIPRDPEEAEVVDTIIRTFKFHMLPEYQKGGAGRYFTVPSEFELYYMYRGDENTWLNKLKTCVLTNMEVNYTPNTNWQTLRPTQGRNGAPPSEIDMKLDFQETDLVTKEDILEGF